MTLRHLHIFKTVCDCNGISAAAEKLNMTQPSVSIAIKELEVFYSTRLFDRISRRIYLTEAGVMLLSYAENILSECDEIAHTLRSGKILKKCRLGVNVSYAETHLPKVLAEIKQAVPECILKITVNNNEMLERMLSENKIDLAIYDSSSERSGKESFYLFCEEVFALCSPSLYENEIISIETLSSLPLLLREDGSGMRACVKKIFEDKQFNCILESSSNLNLITLAKKAFGVIFLPELLAQKEVSEGSLHILKTSQKRMWRFYHLSYNGKKSFNENTEKIKEIILSTH